MLTDNKVNPDEQLLIRDFQSRFKKITGKTCKIFIEDKVEQVLRKLSVAEILNAVDYFRLPNIPSLSDSSRKRELVDLRKISCLLSKKAGYSLATIGNELGERDHTTVIYNIKAAKKHLDTEEQFRNLYMEIECKILELYESRLDNYKKY